jgi:hypothetical protein
LCVFVCVFVGPSDVPVECCLVVGVV